MQWLSSQSLQFTNEYMKVMYLWYMIFLYLFKDYNYHLCIITSWIKPHSWTINFFMRLWISLTYIRPNTRVGCLLLLYFPLADDALASIGQTTCLICFTVYNFVPSLWSYCLHGPDSTYLYMQLKCPAW